MIAMGWFPKTELPSSRIVKAKFTMFSPLAILVPSPVNFILTVLGRLIIPFIFPTREVKQTVIHAPISFAVHQYG